jgi:hypothetical protein
MRTSLSVFTFLILACHPCAGDEPKPNTLTPKEIAEGWILLFDGESTFGWRVVGDAKVEKGELTLGGAKPATATSTSALPWSRAHGVSMETRWEGKESPTFWFAFGGMVGLTDAAKSKFVRQFMSTDDGLPGNEFGPQGYKVPAGSKLFLKDIKYQPRKLKPLFNGKDLAGWKVHSGKKSKFSVTPEGWIHLKDGPGDLQSEARYDDFILQLECKTNGKLLNSGVFFRCQPGEYQQGYEAQIHNGFDADKPKEYVVEEYDPKTNELKAKNKMKSPAVDYGTGGIYRRVPARKQAAKDGEWFTMTVIAHGRHIATWVNGIQMVDWTDNRPLKDNARNGCRLEKGAISLQGHDATTDLYFRNIRIAELPKPAEKK